MLLLVLLLVAVLGLIGYAISSVVAYKTNSEVRSSKSKSLEIKDLESKITSLKRQKIVAMDSLNKITADYTHNPALEARVALDDIRGLEIQEIVKGQNN